MHVYKHMQQMIAMQSHFHAGLGNSSTEARAASRFKYLPYRVGLVTCTCHYTMFI